MQNLEMMARAAPEAHWMKFALAEYGVSEIRGRGHNRRIIEYYAATTLKAQTDEVPWCASFVNWVLKQDGSRGSGSAAAASFSDWGVATQPRFGCIVHIFRAPRGGDRATGSSSGNHVAFLISKSDTHIRLLGGNQGDTVKPSTFSLAKYKVRSFRWPAKSSEISMFRISRLAALLLLTGCELGDSVSSGRSSDVQPVRKAIAAAQPKAASKPSKETKVKQHLEFATFWPAFRQAVLRDDMDAIAGFVRFPVIGRGEMDDDPEESIDRKSFAPIFREALSQDGVIRSQDGSTRSGSLLELIQAFPTYRDHQAMEGDARFDALRFERTDPGWKLIMIYTGPQD